MAEDSILEEYTEMKCLYFLLKKIDSRVLYVAMKKLVQMDKIE